MRHQLAKICFFSLIIGMSFLIYSCNKNIVIHTIQKKIEGNKLENGYRPFLKDDIKKICILESGEFLDNYNSIESNVPYGYMAILEITETNTKIGYIKEGLLTHKFKLNSGAGYCTSDAKRLELNRSGNIWVLSKEGE